MPERKYKNIQEHLATIDYSFKDYMPSKESMQLIGFINAVNGGREENESPLVHCLMIDKMVNSSRRTAIMAARGLSKSSLIEYLILYLACFNELGSIKDPKFILYVADSIENGVKKFRNSIEENYARSKYMQELIPNKSIKLLATDTKSGREFELSDNDVNDLSNAGRSITDARIRFINNKGQSLIINCYGVQTGIRGTKAAKVRPSIAFLDDLIKETDARSETLLKLIEDIVYQSIPYALHPVKQKIIWVGTPFNSADPLYKAIDSGIWDSLVLPICEKFPCEKEEFKGAWEDRFSYDVVDGFYKDTLAKGNARGFYQELMMSIINEDDILIDSKKLIYVDDSSMTKTDFASYNYYITTDLAVSTKNSADYSVISVWAYTSNEDFILVDGFCGRILVDDFIKKLFIYATKYKPQQVGIEVTGQQGGFVQWIYNEQFKNKIYFNIKEVRPTKDKYSRFLTFAPYYHRNKVKIFKSMKENKAYHNELLDELTKTTINDGFKSKHDDVLDTHSMLQELDLFPPSYSIDDRTPNLVITNYGYFWDTPKDKPLSRNNYI